MASASFALFALLSSPALAAFERPFVRQIAGRPGEPFPEPGGVAVDAGNNLWVSELVPLPSRLDEFDPSGAYVKSVELKEGITHPASVSISEATHRFYVTGESSEGDFPPYVEAFNEEGSRIPTQFSAFGDPARITVDNSTDPLDLSAGSVYVAHGSADPSPPFGDGLSRGVKRTNAAGEAMEFEFKGPFGSNEYRYIGGSEITGTPAGAFVGTLAGIAVDPEGDIYVLGRLEAGIAREEQAVYEYLPDGAYVREFSGDDTPRLTEQREPAGFGGYNQFVEGLAVDPVSRHLLVAVDDVYGKGAIDEFDSSGVFLHQTTEIEASGASKPLRHISALATDSTGAVYALSNAEKAVDVFGPGHFLPTLTLGEPVSLSSSSATVTGSFDPEGQTPSECWFEYVSKAAFEATGFNNLSSGGRVPCEPSVGEIQPTSEPQPVRANLTKLVSGVTYRYRLTAATSGPLGGASHTEPLALTALHAPRIDASTAADISSRFAELRASIAPLGADTHYRFEYDTVPYSSTAAHGSSMPVPSADIGSGGATGAADANVAQHIGPLIPGSVYHFRVVAENEVGVEYRPDEEFTTLPPSGQALPDERAYEMLTPANKGSAEDLFAESEFFFHQFDNKDAGYPTDSGEEFLLESEAAMSDAEHPFTASDWNTYVFHRNEEERRWTMTPLAPADLGVQSIRPGVFDPSSFSQVGIFDLSGSQASPSGVKELAMLASSDGLFEAIHSQDAPPNGVREAPLVGASRDLSHIVLQTEDPLLAPPGTDANAPVLYDWAQGRLTLLSVNAEGKSFACGAWLGQSRLAGSRRNAVSSDGSRVLFTAPDPYLRSGKGCWSQATSNAPQIYMRLPGETVQVSAPEGGVVEEVEKGVFRSPARHAAIYAGASEDGTRVFFITETEMTKEAAQLKLHDPELYECEIAEEGTSQKCKLTRVSAGQSHDTAALLHNVPTISADGSSVYFTAFAALTPNAPQDPPTPGAGAVNLYRYDVRDGTTTHIANVATVDYPSNDEGWWLTDSAEFLGHEVSFDPRASWYTTPDGRYLLFASIESLTGYSTAEAKQFDCPAFDIQFSTLNACSEVYRYDSATGTVVCVSCDPSGAAPVSNAFFGHAANPHTPAGGQVRAMSDDGSYVFFDSADALVPQASNGTNDVFEWEARGTGGCGLTQGCVHLISSGVERGPSFFLGASADGSNVFFGTHARLVPQDRDNSGDLYDARVGGGFPSPPPRPPCEGDACQNPVVVPIDATPSSMTFSGEGDASGNAAHKIKRAGRGNRSRGPRACRRKPKTGVKRCKARTRRHRPKTSSGRAATR